MTRIRWDVSVNDQMIADQETLIIRMEPDDPALPDARRRLDELRRNPAPRRVPT